MSWEAAAAAEDRRLVAVLTRSAEDDWELLAALAEDDRELLAALAEAEEPSPPTRRLLNLDALDLDTEGGTL